MSWLKFDCSTPEKPEVLRITIAMGWDDPDLTVGKLLKVWRWFDAHSVDGNAAGVTLTLLDRLIGVAGMAQAMVEAEWLSVTDIGLSLPNFENHNGKTAKDRALTAKRAANFRGNDKSNAPTVTNALPREEKRREEPIVLLSPAKLPTCPANEIVSLYHAVLPSLPTVRLMNDKRKKAITKFWQFVLTSKKSDGTARATNGDEATAWIKAYFERANENDFLMGRGARSAEHANWECDIDFLMSDKGMKQVIEKTRDTAS